jgi:hypothetical protein
MAKVKKNKKRRTKKTIGIIDPHMEDFSNDPFFVKKAEEAKAFLRKHGVPEGFPPFEG